MRKKLILFLMLALFGSSSFLWADEQTFGFEDGLPTGWVVLDANNDGYTWCLTSAIPTTWTYYSSSSLDWYRTGTNAICSGSYINGVGALTPNDYLVTTKATLGSSSSFSFWAAATDASYPEEHFGVFVSEDGSTWTSVQEWDLTAKSGGHNGGRESRDGNGAKLGAWYQFTANLASYAGEKFIAIRHFDCNDQYIMCVDDITATNITFSNESLDTGGSGGGGSTSSDIITIGEGTTSNSYLPSYSLYNYSLTQQIYTADEIGIGATTFNSIAFYNSGSTKTRSYDMYLVNTDKETFSSTTDWITVTDADKVFSGSVDMTAGTWTTITLDTPFGYTGGNLAIIMDDNTGSWSGGMSCYVFSAPNQALRIYSDPTNYDPIDPSSYTGTLMDVKNQIQIGLPESGGGGDDPGITDPWTPDYDAPLGVIDIVYPQMGQQNVPTPLKLRWSNAENAAQYKVEFGSVYVSLETLVDWTDVEGWNGKLVLADYNITLDPNTRYYWKVYNMNNTGEVEAIGLFTTVFNTPTNVRLTETEIFTDESTIVKWNIVGGAISELPETIIGEGTNTNNYLPTYNLYNYSLTQQIYTGEEIGGAGIINSLSFYPVGSITRNLDIYMVNTDKTSFSGGSDWITVTADDLVYSGNVAMTPNTWTTVNLVNPFTFDGTNLAIVVDDNTGTWTSSIYYNVFSAPAQAIRIYSDDTNYTPSNPAGYSGTVMDVKNQIALNHGAKGIFGDRDLLGCNVYVDSVKVNTEPITEREYELTNLAYMMGEGHAVNVTGIYDIGESNFSNTVYVKVSGYTTVTGVIKDLITEDPIADVLVKLEGKDEFNNTVSYIDTTATDGTYNINNVKVGQYTLKATCGAYEPVKVEDLDIVYAETNELDVIYMHEVYSPVYQVYAEVIDTLNNEMAKVTWSFGNTGGGGSTGGGDTFTVDFEGGLPTGWNVIDANNDGYTWCLTSAIPTTWTYYGSLTLDWYHNGTNAICSGSYINGVGALTPNEYLITPQLTLANGSTFSFWAAACDASYAADHFGVFVSDDATNWTMVNEWTLTAKSGSNNGGRASRDGNGAKLGTWHNFTVDLSAYAGEKYIAIRHFNCNDMYIMCVDDIELSNGSKADNLADECGYHNYNATSREMWDLLGEVNCTSGYQYGVATDGNYIYTSSWSASSTSQFYKYDMDGNFIEEFNVSGSGQIRDLTYDGEYFYGVANSSTVYCLDLANHALVSTFTSAYGAMRCCGYDSERDGFWVVGNWSGNLTLIDRTGAIQFTGPAPTSASGVAYFKDADGVEHVYCFNNGDNGVYDYNIATNTIVGSVFNYNSAPGYASGSSGGCHIANYGGKLAFYGDLQQSPNYIAIYELGEAAGSGSSTTGGSQLATVDHYFQIWRRPVLIENMPTDPAEIEALAIQIAETDPANGFNDTLYTDMVYADLEAGVYEYGVAAVYPWIDRNDNNVTPITWSNDLEHNMTTTLTINASCALGLDRIEGAVVTLYNEAEDFTVTAELDSAVWMQEDFRKGHYLVTVDLPGYLALVEGNPIPADGLALNLWLDEPVINIEFVEDYAPVSSLVVSQTGFARWTDMLPHERVALRYHVMCDDIFQGETEENYMILNTENLVDGETYTAAVAVVYETGMSDFVTADFTYMTCDHVASQVENLESSVELADVTLTWADGAGTGGGGGGGGGGTATTFTEGFESGLPTGWTVVDGNSDGWTWCLTSAIPTTWTYYATITLDWYRTGSNAICSGSYINGVGALTPNEYLVTPQVTLAAGSTFSFWAAACDASYAADHFGVFVSDDATNWTMVNEWTLTAKSGGNDGGRASRDGNGAKLGTWYNYTVDLSSYAGDKYIAIRHFNCNDMYIMCVDDIELSSSAKSGNEFMAAGHGFGLANNSLSDDGNWYYYDNGVNEDAIGTGGGNFWWGIMLPAGSYEGNSLTKVAAYDYMAMTGTASIYQGGTTAPSGSALGTVNVSLTGSNDFVEFTFADAVTLDPTQNVWVVFYNGSGATYPAAVCTNTGDANGRWVSLDGSTWEDLAGYGLSYTFMVRAYIESAGGGGGGGTTTTSITPNAYNIFMDGEFIGATTDTTFTYTCEDDLEHEYCVMFVDADYNISCENCVVVKADPLGVGQYNVVSAIYPNPTNGNLYINTNANMKSISIVNVLGQVVYNKAAEGTETIIDMAQFGNGIYMVNIITENGTSVNRIIVNK